LMGHHVEAFIYVLGISLQQFNAQKFAKVLVVLVSSHNLNFSINLNIAELYLHGTRRWWKWMPFTMNIVKTLPMIYSSICMSLQYTNPFFHGICDFSHPIAYKRIPKNWKWISVLKFSNINPSGIGKND